MRRHPCRRADRTALARRDAPTPSAPSKTQRKQRDARRCRRSASALAALPAERLARSTLPERAARGDRRAARRITLARGPAAPDAVHRQADAQRRRRSRCARRSRDATGASQRGAWR
ncbi:MAG: hypothetical protein MZV65_44445 [Chromatiales bacterium]|nr:hypothetical protein [Chromatiales bacterium]